MKKHLNEVKRLQKIAGILKENVNEARGFNSQKLISFLQSRGPKPVGSAPEGEYNVTLAYEGGPSIPTSEMTGARDAFMSVVKACGGEATLNGAPTDIQNYAVKGCALSDIEAMWQFLASDETYSVDTPTTTKANGSASTWLINPPGENDFPGSDLDPYSDPDFDPTQEHEYFWRQRKLAAMNAKK